MKITNVFLIPHFHFDFEWWKEEPYHEEDACIIIEKALELLQKCPQFTYVIDQVLPLKYFLEQNPNRQQELKQLLDERRLELVGGGLVAPDENLPTGEGLIRQFFQGKQWVKEHLNCEVKVGWEIDEFGHPAQVPQIFSLLGFRYFVFSRGVNPYNKNHPTLFWWKDPSGEKELLTYWWAAHYLCADPSMLSSNITKEKFFKEIDARIRYEGKRSPVPYLMFPLGGDFTLPLEEWIDFVKDWNNEHDTQLQFSVPSRYFEAVEHQTLPEIQGEFNPVFTGCYSSREQLKKRSRELQHRLTSFEKLSSLTTILGNTFPAQKIKTAWWELLKGDFHDTICGTGTDRVYQKSLERYDVVEKILDHCESEVTCFLERTLKGKKDVVFNLLNWTREEWVKTKKGWNQVKIPALGVVPVPTSSATVDTVNVSSHSLENRVVRVDCDERSGTIRVYDKERNLDVISGGGNNIDIKTDVGNLWTTVGTGNGHRLHCKGIEIKKKTPQVGILCMKEGNAFVDIEKDVVLYANKKQVDFTTHINFKGKDKRIDVCFPFPFNGSWFGEEPFDVVQKADGMWAVQNAVMYKGDHYAIGILNRGIPSHAFEGSVCRLTVLRSVSIFPPQLLLWCLTHARILGECIRNALSHIKHHLNIAEWAMYPAHHLLLREWATEGESQGFGTMDVSIHLRAYTKLFREALCWERGLHTFSYSLVLDIKDTQELVRKGWEFAMPIHVQPINGSGDKPSISLFKKDIDGIVVSALIPHKDGLLMRCYNPNRQQREVTFTFAIPVKKVFVSDSFGNNRKELPQKNGTFKFSFERGELANFVVTQ
ncbi:MAG: hypothetical protein JW771_02230 [Candidatus Thermoplasmatota archaeon]|nr:hypothetical protein [Candidatus Thermoplasmatota archaeon]